MGSCPKCNYKFSLFDVRAECPVCGVNIPNYNWEERLEADSVNAEKAFEVFRAHTGAFKQTLFGSALNKVRFIMTFAPLVVLVIPLAGYTLSLPFNSGARSLSVLNVILGIVNGKINIGDMLPLASLDRGGAAFTALYAALGLVAVGVVAAVLNFFVEIIGAFGSHTKGCIICCAVSAAAFAGAAAALIVASVRFGNELPEIVSMHIGAGVFVGTALFVVNAALIAAVRKKIKNNA